MLHDILHGRTLRQWRTNPQQSFLTSFSPQSPSSSVSGCVFALAGASCSWWPLTLLKFAFLCSSVSMFQSLQCDSVICSKPVSTTAIHHLPSGCRSLSFHSSSLHFICLCSNPHFLENFCPSINSITSPDLCTYALKLAPLFVLSFNPTVTFDTPACPPPQHTSYVCTTSVYVAVAPPLPSSLSW